MVDDLVGRMTAAPVGAALLAALELAALVRGGDRPPPMGRPLDGADPDRIAAAIDLVAAMPPGELLAMAVEQATATVGPWVPTAPDDTAQVLRDAPRRAALADTVIARLGPRLHAPAARDGQLWWSPGDALDDQAQPLGRSPHRPYSAWVTATVDGLWTSTPAETLLDEPLVEAWEFLSGPVACWQLTVNPAARVFEIDGPDDWARLVQAAPLARDDRPNTSWEFPGMNRNRYDVDALDRVEGQRAMRRRESFRRFVEPDWDAVATRWDAVHLTWAGFLTTEGLVIDLDEGDVTMLRNWCSERTLWLNPVLRDPRPAPAPELTGAINGIRGLELAGDPRRAAHDLRWLHHKLDLRPQ